MDINKLTTLSRLKTFVAKATSVTDEVEVENEEQDYKKDRTLKVSFPDTSPNFWSALLRFGGNDVLINLPQDKARLKEIVDLLDVVVLTRSMQSCLEDLSRWRLAAETPLLVHTTPEIANTIRRDYNELKGLVLEPIAADKVFDVLGLSLILFPVDRYKYAELVVDNVLDFTVVDIEVYPDQEDEVKHKWEDKDIPTITIPRERLTNNK